MSVRNLETIFVHADRNPVVGGGCRSAMVYRRRLPRWADAVPAADRERWDRVVLVDDPNAAQSPRGCMPALKRVVAIGDNVMQGDIAHVVDDGLH